MRNIGVVVVGCFVLIALNGTAFSQQPTEFEFLLASAQQAQARGDFGAAAEFYRKAASVQPEIAELQANLGLMYYQTGKDQQAIAAFRQAIRLKPNLFVPNLFLGLDYLRVKRFREAIPCLKRAALMKPTDVQTSLALGQAYAAIGKTRVAIDSYSRTVQADSSNADGWFHLGVAYLEQVEANARTLLARHKDSGYLHALVADTFAEQRAYVQAAEAYKTTLASQAFPLGTHAAYGFVLLSQNDLQGAEREWKTELGSNPGSLAAKLGLARFEIEQGEVQKGVTEIVAIWKADAAFLRANIWIFTNGLSASKRSELNRTLEDARAAGEIPESMVALFDGAPATNSNSTDSLQPSISAVGRKGRSTSKSIATVGRSEECADQPVAGLPLKQLRFMVSCSYSRAKYQKSFEAGQKLAASPATEAEGLYWETKSAQKLATAALARASALDSNSPILHVLLGDIYRQRKYYPDAEQEYRKALAIHSDEVGALLGLSLALLADSDIEQALRLAQAALNKNPDDPEFNAVMGEILSAQHDFSGAEPYLKKALHTKPELLPHVHALLGRAYAEANRTQEAITEFKLGLADDKDGRLHYQLARLYLKIGDRNSAKEAFAASERLRGEGLTRAAVAMQQGEGASESQ